MSIFSGPDQFARILAEAALRSRAVARWLRTKDDSQFWKAAALGVSRCARWFKPGVLPECDLTRILSAALKRDVPATPFLMLNILQRIRPPGASRPFWLVALLPGVLTAAIFGVLCALFPYPLVVRPSGALMFVFGYGWMFACSYRFIRERAFYRWVVRARPPPAIETSAQVPSRWTGKVAEWLFSSDEEFLVSTAKAGLRLLRERSDESRRELGRFIALIDPSAMRLLERVFAAAASVGAPSDSGPQLPPE